MSDEEEKIYDSGPEQPDDEFWLAQGTKMVEESMPAVREAAKSLMTGLGLLKGIYLGVLGFSDYVPKTMWLPYKSLFLLPFLFWLAALYCCLCVMMTTRYEINLHSPDDIRNKSESVLAAKQSNLRWAFWMFAVGLLTAILLMVFCFGL